MLKKKPFIYWKKNYEHEIHDKSNEASAMLSYPISAVICNLHWHNKTYKHNIMLVSNYDTKKPRLITFQLINQIYATDKNV